MLVVLAGIAAWGMFVSSGWLASTLRQTVVTRLGEALGRPVALGSVGGNPWDGFDLRNLVIAEPGGFSKGVAFSADLIHIQIDLAALMLHPGDLAQSVARIEVDTPRIAVARYASGAWNLRDLGGHGGNRSQGPAGGPGIRLQIVVNGGIVGFSDGWESASAPFETRFSGINGTVDVDTAHQIAFNLGGRSANGEQAGVRGKYLTADGLFDLDVEWKNGDAKRWGAYLLRAQDVQWNGGRFDARAHLLVTGLSADVALDYSATVQLRGGAMEYLPKRLDLRSVSGTIVLGDTRANTPSLSAVVNGMPVQLRGSVDFPAQAQAWLDLVVRSPRIDLGMVRRLFFEGGALGLVGQAQGDVWIMGPLDAPRLDGTVDAASGRLNSAAFSALRTRFQYGAGLLAVSDLSARVAGGRVAGSAVVGVSGTPGSYAFVTTADNVDVQTLGGVGLSLPAGVSGRASGDVAGVGSGTRAYVLGNVTVPAGAAHGISFADLHALFWDDAGALSLDFARLRRDGAIAYGFGELSRTGHLDLAVSAFALPLDQIQSWAGAAPTHNPLLALAGQANLDGAVDGTIASPVVSGKITAWDGQLGELVPFDFARGDVELGAHRIGATHLSLVSGAASYDVSGQVELAPLSAEGLSVRISGVPAEPLAHALAPDVDVSGTLFGHATVSGPLAHPSVSGSASLLQGSLSGQHVDKASVEFAGTAGRVRVESFAASVNDSHVNATGEVDIGGPVALDISSDRINLSDIPWVAQAGVPLSGSVSLSGRMTGTMGNPELKAAVESPALTINGQQFEASGIVDYRAHTVSMSPLSLVQNDQQYGVTGTLTLGARPAANLNFSVRHGQIATIMAASSSASPVSVSGTIDGNIAFRGPLADPAAHIALTLQDGQVDGVLLGAGTADVTLTHGTVDIQTLELRPQRGSISARGRVELKGSSSVELSGQDLDVNMLRPVFRMGPKDALTGTMGFTVQWGGPTHDPTAGLSLTAENAGLPNATVDSINVLAFYKDGIMNVENGTMSKGTHQLTLVGTLPLNPGRFNLTPNGPLDLRLSLADTDLSFLSVISPAIRDATGTIAGDVTIAGTPSSPQMSGTLQSHDGRFYIASIPQPLENLNIDIAFSQSEVVLKTLSATIGGGTIAGEGTMSVRNLQPDTLALALTAHNLTVTVPGLYTGGADGSLKFTGPARGPTLTGTVTLSNGTVALTASGAGPGAGGAAPSIPLGLDASLVIGDNVNFVQSPARARLTGKIHASGTLDKPALSGQIEAVNGTVTLLGTPYTLTQGVVTFSEDRGIYPQIAVTAQGLYGPTRVLLSITGALPNPTISLSSDPPMSQDQILALISGTNGGQGSATGLLSQVLFGSLTSSMQQAFGLDMTVSYESQAPLNLQIGKYLLSNLYLSVGAVVGRTSGYNRQAFGTLQPTNPNGEPYTVLGLQYTLSPSLSLSYYADSFGDNAIFLLNRIQF